MSFNPAEKRDHTGKWTKADFLAAAKKAFENGHITAPEHTRAKVAADLHGKGRDDGGENYHPDVLAKGLRSKARKHEASKNASLAETHRNASQAALKIKAAQSKPDKPEGASRPVKDSSAQAARAKLLDRQKAIYDKQIAEHGDHSKALAAAKTDKKAIQERKNRRRATGEPTPDPKKRLAELLNSSRANTPAERAELLKLRKQADSTPTGQSLDQALKSGLAEAAQRKGKKLNPMEAHRERGDIVQRHAKSEGKDPSLAHAKWTKSPAGQASTQAALDHFNKRSDNSAQRIAGDAVKKAKSSTSSQAELDSIAKMKQRANELDALPNPTSAQRAQSKSLRRQARQAEQDRRKRDRGGITDKQHAENQLADKSKLPKGYTLHDSGDPAAKHEVRAPDGRTVSIEAKRADAIKAAHSHVKENKATGSPPHQAPRQAPSSHEHTPGVRTVKHGVPLNQAGVQGHIEVDGQRYDLHLINPRSMQYQWQYGDGTPVPPESNLNGALWGHFNHGPNTSDFRSLDDHAATLRDPNAAKDTNHLQEMRANIRSGIKPTHGAAQPELSPDERHMLAAALDGNALDAGEGPDPVAAKLRAGEPLTQGEMRHAADGAKINPASSSSLLLSIAADKLKNHGESKSSGKA